MEPLKLTAVEITAKSLFSRLITEAGGKPCDVGFNFELELPRWYDESKFRRRQQYFANNRYGVIQSMVIGLILLLAEPNAARILYNTGRSATPELARKRYTSTLLRIVSWYEIDFSPGSKLWTSLNQVRRMHLQTSRKRTKPG